MRSRNKRLGAESVGTLRLRNERKGAESYESVQTMPVEQEQKVSSNG